MFPRISPSPVRVVVIVIVFVPVRSVPNIMFTVDADILLCGIMSVAVLALLTVRILNVVAPLIVVFRLPRNWIVLEPAVKLPELSQSS